VKRHDTISFAVLSAGILLAGAGGLAALWPTAHAAARSQSAQLLADGTQAGGTEAANDFLLATYLDPANQAAQTKLAQMQLAQGRPDQALRTLSRAGQGSDVEQLKVRTLMELSQTNAAADEADVLAAPGRPDEDLVLAGLAYAVTGRDAQTRDLAARVGSVEASGRLARATASSVTLATELYASGLLNSSSVILERLAPSYERNTLYARILTDRGTKAGLNQAAKLLNQAVAMDPASIETRRALAEVYRELHHQDAATEQETAIAKLQAGRP
jgi:hypothetical protein